MVAVPEGRGVDVIIRDPEACPRYLARIVTGLRVGPSPLELRIRLAACGVRAISNIVDVTNLVMLETGHPLHAFDQERLKGGIQVRRADRAERHDDPRWHRARRFRNATSSLPTNAGPSRSQASWAGRRGGLGDNDVGCSRDGHLRPTLHPADVEAAGAAQRSVAPIRTRRRRGRDPARQPTGRRHARAPRGRRRWWAKASIVYPRSGRAGAGVAFVCGVDAPGRIRDSARPGGAKLAASASPPHPTARAG